MTQSPPEIPKDWFKNWFNDQYLKVYSHRNQTEAKQFLTKLPIWDDIDRGAFCLDLGCGSGRYAVEIAQHGLNVIALDLSVPLLLTAVKENSIPKQILYVRGDMRQIPAKPVFSLIVSLFTSFGYFSDDEHQQMLRNTKELLKSNGLFILDIPNPKAVRKNVLNNRFSIRIEDDLQIREERYLSDDGLRVIKYIKLDCKGESKEYYESVRLYDAEELNLMFDNCGLISKYPTQGDYNGEPFNKESPRMIYFTGVK
ncbi:methyltransferase domain-containing protein [bacterium]|nr:methyltransferase domain-containing protein [bacterium]